MSLFAPTVSTSSPSTATALQTGWRASVPAAAGFVAGLSRAKTAAELAPTAAEAAATPRRQARSPLDIESLPTRNGAIDMTALPQRLASELKRFAADSNSQLRELGVAIPPAVKLMAGMNGAVLVDGDHPDKARIEQLFADNEQLRNRFIQISNVSNDIRAYQLSQQSQRDYTRLMQKGALDQVSWLVERTSGDIRQLASRVTLDGQGGSVSVSGGGTTLDPTGVDLRLA
ncbi:hypothetical protein OL229_15835 [Neisseriaceae bacterium JH1-16]|nr:hypothetical protein [Neisseriaceae bacterium JH1-16]